MRSRTSLQPNVLETLLSFADVNSYANRMPPTNDVLEPMRLSTSNATSQRT